MKLDYLCWQQIYIYNRPLSRPVGKLYSKMEYMLISSREHQLVHSADCKVSHLKGAMDVQLE